MSTYALIAGGGIRVNYATGCMYRLKQMDSPLLQDLGVVSGVSAGSILASALATDCDLGNTYDKFANTEFVHKPNTCAMVSRAVSMYTGYRDAFYNNEQLKSTLLHLVGGKMVTGAQSIRVYAIDTATQKQHAFEFLKHNEVTVNPIVASCSIPALFPPVHIDGRKYVDGGLHNSFAVPDIKRGIQDPNVHLIMLFATSPWMGRRNDTHTLGFKRMLQDQLHALMELDHWHLMDMLDIEHDSVPNGRFMALYKRHEHGLELLQIMQPGHKRQTKHDLAVIFFAPTPLEYVGAESVSLKDHPSARKPTSDMMLSKGKIAAAEVNTLASEIGLGWSHRIRFT